MTDDQHNHSGNPPLRKPAWLKVSGFSGRG